jgi:hypothetical protein
MNKIICTTLATIMCLSIFAMAIPDSVVTGPYNVTFDLGLPKEAYKVEIADPVTKESLSGEISTTYEIKLINKTGLTRRASISLISHEVEQVIPTQDDIVKTLKYVLINTKDIYDIDAAGRKIDGYDGAVASGTLRSSGIETSTYIAIYYPSSTMSVTVFSAYPWDEGTLSLLKTIHIENINSTSLVGPV